MKIVKEFGPAIIWLVLFSFLAAMMIHHFRYISIPNDPVDQEAAMLKEIRRIMPAGSQASFVTNLSEDEASQGAYYRTQFGWCPGILSNDPNSNDNIIFYRSPAAKDSSMGFLDHCDTLYRGTGGSYTLLLLHKKNSQ